MFIYIFSSIFVHYFEIPNDEVGLKRFVQILLERQREMNTTLEEEREEHVFCFDRTEPDRND